MAKPRLKDHEGLPKGWRQKGNAFYYRVPKGLEALWDGKTEFKLGDSLPEAYKSWAARLAASEHRPEVGTVGQLLDRYALEVIPTKALRSQESNRNQLKMLRAVFGNTPLTEIVPKTVYIYVDRRSKKKKDPETGKVTGGKIAAHREVELLSHAFTKAVQWGYIERHPFKGEIELEGEDSRDRYIEDDEVIEMLSLQPRRKSGSVLMIQAYIRLKLLTGLAQGDLLRLTMDQLQDDGIHVIRHKTKKKVGRRTIYRWTPELKRAVELAKEARPKKDSAFLFCTREGKGYIDPEKGSQAGWKSMWQRFMERVLDETAIKEKFTEHDLRAKVGSDAHSLDHARSLLQHADSRTTQRVYRRKAEIVEPLR